MEPIHALQQALDGWRETRHPRFARVVEWATARALPTPRALIGHGKKKTDVAAWQELYERRDVLDVPRLVAAAGGGTSQMAADRLGLLAKLDDPRVVSGVLGLLEAPPYRAKTATPFFRACARVLAESGDPRVRPALVDLAGRYKSIIDSSMGNDVAILLRRTADSLDEVEPGPLPPPWEDTARRLEEHFEAELAQAGRDQATRRSAAQSDDAFLDAIYAAPDDDAPRLVFADTLIERGEARGEFIALQVRHARGQATPESLARERELASNPKHRGAWGHPLSEGGLCRFHRGFTEELVIEPRTFKQIVGQPALRTVKRVHRFGPSVPLKHAKAFLEHPNARHLTEVESLPANVFDALEGELTWPEVGLTFMPTRAQLARLPNLKRLKAHAAWNEPFDAAGLVGLERLEAFECTGASAQTDILSGMPNLRSLSLAGRVEKPLLAAMLAGRKLQKLALMWTPPAGAVRLESLEELTLTLQGDAPSLGALFDDFPRLNALTLNSHPLRPELLPSLFSEPRVRQLELLRVGHRFALRRPGRSDGEAEVRMFSAYEPEIALTVKAIAALPDGLVRRVVMRPASADVHSPTGPLPSEEVQARLRGAKPGLPLDIEWW
ncbi:MAG: TIGR02996 domain-containing protein [Myxococcota bacterium]